MSSRSRPAKANAPKLPRPGYRKAMIYETFCEKGEKSALDQARKLRIKESTARTWISRWRRPKGIGIRDLQRLSADAISALPGTTPIRSDERTVALLIPLRAADPERLATVLKQAEDLARGRDHGADDAALSSFGAVDPVDWSLDAVRKLQTECLAMQ